MVGRMSEDKRDGIAMLSRATGISTQDIAALAAEVRANQAKLTACSGHDFEPVPGARVVFGQPDRYRCKHCEGTVDRHAFYWFEQGRLARC